MHLPPFVSRRLLASLAPLAALALAGCGRSPADPMDPTAPKAPIGVAPGDTARAPALLEALPRPLTDVERQAAAAGTEFSLALFREVSRRKAGANVFVSPLSAAVALAMTAQGAGGETAVAMRRTLGFPTQTLAQMGEGYRGLLALITALDPSVTLRSANAIWYRDTFAVEPSFVDAARRLFGADVAAADFRDVPGTLARVNGWAREKTNGKIEKVLDQIKDEHVMFLLNALYFKGSWRDQFDPRQTRSEAFTSSAGRAAAAPLMRRSGSMRHARGDGYQAVDLPYGNGAFSMTVLLPDPGRTADALAASLDPARWDDLQRRLAPAPVELVLPRFTMKYEDEWKDVLTTLGMGVAFTDRADFTGISRAGRLLLDFVKQDTYVDVNEEGTEAAAVTSIGVGVTSVQVPQVMRVDRPFVFAIRERLTGALLFVGKVNALP